MRVMVTGATGFIGSHLVVCLLEAGHDVIAVDDCSNSHGPETLERIAAITGRLAEAAWHDVRDTQALTAIMTFGRVDAIIHLAARKSVPESVSLPIEYYRVNVDGLCSVIQAARTSGVRRFVFSSSGSVYGNADHLPIPESAPHRATNPYSVTKSLGERILQDLCVTDDSWRVVALRYFNPAGAHPSGLIGEDPRGPVSNLLPVLMDVAAGVRPNVNIWGDDFDTPDGTGVRDYVHVVDVADAHLRSLDLLERQHGFEAINIGRGVGVSVRELHDAAERASGRIIRTITLPRRPGDVAALFGDPTRAAELLGMSDYRNTDEICADAWRWRSQNPSGLAADEIGAA